MYEKLRSFLKRNKRLHEAYLRARFVFRYEARDIWDAYFAKRLAAKVTPYGFKLLGSSSAHHKAMQNGTFEPEEVELFRSEFEAADVFVDIGANIGFYTCLARSTGCHVIAVEPMQKNLEHLLANLLANKWSDVEVFPLGLSKEPGLATLYGASSTGASLIGNWAGQTRLFQRTISLSTLDIVLGRRFQGEKLFIKIDVEGAEYSVLQGAIGVLNLDPKPTWILEVCLNEYHPAGVNPDFGKVFEFFWQSGYEVFTANKDRTQIRPSDLEGWLSRGGCDSGAINYICVPTLRQPHL